MTNEESRAYVACVTDVQPHPESDNLDIVTIAGRINIANRPAIGQPRYAIGDYAIVLEENLILPDWLLKHIDMWDHQKNKGVLAGSKGNRTKGRNIAGIRSEVALCAVTWQLDDVNPIEGHPDHSLQHYRLTVNEEFGGFVAKIVKTNDEKREPLHFDVTDMLDIIRYEPPT